jgi:hypothetical protein
MISMRVSDISGRTIELKSQLRPNGSVEVGSGYFPGTYIAEIIQGKEKVVVRLVKTIQINPLPGILKSCLIKI